MTEAFRRPVKEKSSLLWSTPVRDAQRTQIICTQTHWERKVEQILRPPTILIRKIGFRVNNIVRGGGAFLVCIHHRLKATSHSHKAGHTET